MTGWSSHCRRPPGRGRPRQPRSRPSRARPRDLCRKAAAPFPRPMTTLPSPVFDRHAVGTGLGGPRPLICSAGKQKLNRRGTNRRPLDVIQLNGTSPGRRPDRLPAASMAAQADARIPAARLERPGQRAHRPRVNRRNPRHGRPSAANSAPLRLYRLRPRHHNLTSWSPAVHFLFARRYRRRGQTVLAHHGLQADRPSEAALIAAGKRSTEYAASIQKAGYGGGGRCRSVDAHPRGMLLVEQ